MSALADTVAAALEDMGWTVLASDTAPPGEHHFLLEAPDGGPGWPIVAVVHDERDVVALYSVLPAATADDSRPDVAAYVTAANHGLLLGSLEIDLNDGEVRMKTSFRAGNVNDLGEELTAQLGFNIAVVATYAPGLAQVLAGEASPLDAIQSVET